MNISFKNKLWTKKIARLLTALVVVTSLVGLIWAWVIQERAANVCEMNFRDLLEHNGYVEIDLQRQHPTDEIFDADMFLYYPQDKIGTAPIY